MAPVADALTIVTTGSFKWPRRVSSYMFLFSRHHAGNSAGFRHLKLPCSHQDWERSVPNVSEQLQGRDSVARHLQTSKFVLPQTFPLAVENGNGRSLFFLNSSLRSRHPCVKVSPTISNDDDPEFRFIMVVALPPSDGDVGLPEET